MKNGTSLLVGETMWVSKSRNGRIITVKDSESEWAVKFGENLSQYKFIDSLIGDEPEEDAINTINALAMIWFSDTNIPWDEEYILKKGKLVDEYINRVRKRTSFATKKDGSIIASMANVELEN